jgi:hypothetical protein
MNYLSERSFSNNVFNNDTYDNMKEAKNVFYEKQKNRALDFMNKNVITPYSRTLLDKKYDDNISAPVSNNFAPTNSFENQFNLYKFDNKEKPIAKNENNRTSILDPVEDSKWSNFDSNDTDMTYGVVNKENFTFENMIPNTKRRDKIIDDQNSYSSRSLGLFTGVGIKPHKKEVEPFFQPKEYYNMPKVDETSNEVRDRYITSVGIKQNDAKPFESNQVNPGESELQKRNIFHDNTRVLPKSIDELRNDNKQQVSHTLPTVQGKLGDRFDGILQQGDVHKYRPEKFKENDPNEITVGRAQVTGSVAPQNFIMKETARNECREIIGPANFKNGYSNINNSGLVKDSVKQQFENLPTSSAGGAVKYNAIGKDYFQVPETGRETTTIQYYGNSNANIGNYASLPDEAKGTIRQELSSIEMNKGPVSGPVKNSYYNNNEAKGTGRQEIMQQIDFYVRGPGGYYSDLQDNAKTTIKETTQQQFNNFANPQQKMTNTYYSDDAKTTIKETTQQPLNTFYSSHQYMPTVSLMDEAKTTIKETTQQQFNNNMGSYMYMPTSGLTDIAKTTVKETTQQQFNNNMGSYMYMPTSGLTDMAKSTIKETTQQQFNNNMGSYMYMPTSGLTDMAKSTIKETTQQQFNNFANSQQKMSYTSFGDELKTTIKETTQQQFNNFANPQQKMTNTYYGDEVKATGRQETDFQQFGYANGGYNGNTVYNQDEVKATGRQETDFQQFGYAYGGYNGNTVYNQDEVKATGRQETNVEHYGYANGGYNGNAIYNQDEVKATGRQETDFQQFGYANGGYNGNTVYNQDEIKATGRQETDFQQFGYANGGYNGNTVYNQDEAKPTIKQSTIIENHISNGKDIGGNVSQLLDDARTTIKQTTMLENYVGNIGSMSTSQLKTYLQDEARSTIKETTILENHISNPSKTINVRTRLDVNNMEQSDNREIISKQRAPTWKGTSQTPDEKLLNVELRNAVTYENRMMPDKSKLGNHKRSSFNYNINKKDVQQNQLIFDEQFLEIMGDTIQSNPLINNILYKGNQHAPLYDNFVYSKS